jgi:hypothetical protein
MLVLVDHEGYCFCNCADTCLYGKCGSTIRCKKEDFEKDGHRVVQLDKKSSTIMQNHIIIDGLYKKLNIQFV